MLATPARSFYPFQGYGQTERVMLGAPAMAFYPQRYGKEGSMVAPPVTCYPFTRGTKEKRDDGMDQEG